MNYCCICACAECGASDLSTTSAHLDSWRKPMVRENSKMPTDPAQLQLATSRCPYGCTFEPWLAEIDRCQACGLGRTTKMTRVAEYQDYTVSRGPGEAKARVRFLERFLFGGRGYLKEILFGRCGYLRDVAPGSLLDVGCGEGLLLDAAEAHRWRAHGIDSFKAHGTDARIWTGSFLEYQPERLFECVCMMHSFEHMADPVLTLSKCATAIRPGGLLLIAVPNFGGAWAKVTGANWPWLNVRDHCFHYTIEALNSLVRQAGFEVERCDTTSAGSPSFAEVYASAHNAFGIWPLRVWPLRSIFYRCTHMMQVPSNAIVDSLNLGAEIIVLARRQ
jgi:SAM-dependent methyltransferase